MSSSTIDSSSSDDNDFTEYSIPKYINDEYYLLKNIGKGGYSYVYLAYSSKSKKYFALKIVSIMFNWKKKTAIYIGRFQPFHEGHKNIFIKALKSSKQVAILVMSSFGVSNKNPLKFKQVKKIIDQALIDYKNKYIIIKIPVVGELVYGRKVGYKIKRIKLSNYLENISATKIRRKLKL